MKYSIYFLFSLLLFVHSSVSSMEEDRDSASTSTLRPLSSSIETSDSPDSSTLKRLENRQVEMTNVQKLKCYFLCCLPVICMGACCNNIGACIDKATCGCFYAVFPCLKGEEEN